MAFTGVRAEESLARSTYDTVSNGQKHSGQMSCHTILDWTSAELYCYIYARHLHLNEAYKKGNMRVGCLVCPNSTGKHEYIKRCSYKTEVDFFLGNRRLEHASMQRFLQVLLGVNVGGCVGVNREAIELLRMIAADVMKISMEIQRTLFGIRFGRE